jgi:predicted porin
MKITHLGAVAILVLLAGVAHAQNSVTLYGLIDEGFNYTSNADGHAGYQLLAGDTAGSRWGIRGIEDLGDGLKAVFHLENGFNVNKGTLNNGGREFGRQAYVGLSSDRFGTLTLGRQYDPTVDLWSGLTAVGNWAGDVAAHPFDNDNADWDTRFNNAIKYLSPTYKGFSGEAMYAFSNAAGSFANNRMYSAAGQYKMGGLTAAVGYIKENNPGSASNTGGAVSGDTLFMDSSEQHIDAGIAYKFAKATIGFAYSHTDVYDPTASAFLSAGANFQPVGGTWKSWKFDNFDLNGQYYFKPDFWMGASYTFTRATVVSTVGRSLPTWNQVALMLDYDLSKRTSIYVQGTYQHVDSHTGTKLDFAQTPASAGLSSTGNQMVCRVAMTHRF